MGLGNRNSKEGDKGSGYSYEIKSLQGLQQSLTLLAGLATEATLQLVLSAIQDGQDFEAKLIEDANGATFLEVRIWNPDTQTWEAPQYYAPGSNTPYSVGDPGGPVAPIVYINNGAVLAQIYAELLDQGLTLDDIELNTDDVATQTTLAALLAAFNAEDFASETTLNSLLTAFNAEDFASQTTLAALLTAFNAEDFATETTLALVNSNTVLGNITLNSLLTAFNAEDFSTETTLSSLNSKFNTLGQKASAASAPVVLSTEQEVILDAIKTAVENIDSDLGTGGLNLEVTQLLVKAVLDAIKLDTANLDVALSTRATEATLASLLTAFNAEDFATETTLLALNAKLNSLGQKASAASAPVVLSTEQEVILDAIKTAVENIDSDLGTGGLNLEATQLLVKAVLDNIKIDTAAMVVDLAAIETLLTTIDAVLDTIKLDTANLDVALSTRLNTFGRKAQTASAPVVLSNEDFASLEAIRVAVQNLDVDVDGIATEVTLAALLAAFNAEDFATETTLAALAGTDFATQTTLAALLTAFNAEDFASQTTLAALLTAFNAEDFSTETTLAALLTAFNAEDFATETTLNAIKLQTDQMSFDGNSALEVVLPTGTNTSFYSRALGSGITVPAGAQKVSIMNIGNDNVTVTTDSTSLVVLDPGIKLEWAAEEGKDLGQFVFANTSPSSLFIVTQVR